MRTFYLSKVAVGLKEQTIVFCGVSFMGESAKVLNPEKTVLMPDMHADCAMAHMADAKTIQKMRNTYEDLAVVCYINSTAELKTHSDVCVTSASAVKIVKALPNKNIFFIPDKNLAHFIAEQVPEKNFVYNEGYCPIHEHMQIEEIKAAKVQHPAAEILKGEKTASEMNYETISEPGLYINTKAAEELGVTVDETLLEGAAETFDSISK